MDQEIEPSGEDNTPLPFQDLVAPEPIEAAPPPAARWLAFALILLGGTLGALVGFGVGDVMGRTTDWAAVGAFLGGLTGAIGVGVVANLTLRAMNEWRAVEHPEAGSTTDDGASDEQATEETGGRPIRFELPDREN